MLVPVGAKRALSTIQEELANSLVAVYLHGSAVAGGLRPRSDLDLLVVVEQPLISKVRRSLASALMEVSGRYPVDPHGRRPLEVIVFLQSELTPLPYPARCAFLYGEWLREEFETGWGSKPAADPEFTVLLALAQQQAKPLVGPETSELLPLVPESEVRRAIRDLLPKLIETLHGDELNVLLTLARMWRTAATGEFVTKDAAAEWAADRLPAEHRAILLEAQEAHRTGSHSPWRSRQLELQRAVRVISEETLARL